MDVDASTVRGSLMDVDDSATVRANAEDRMDLVTEPAERRPPPPLSRTLLVRRWLKDTQDVSMASVASTSSAMSIDTQPGTAASSSSMSVGSSAWTRSTLRDDSVVSAGTASTASFDTSSSSSTLRPPRRMQAFVEVPRRPPRSFRRATSPALTEPAVD